MIANIKIDVTGEFADEEEVKAFEKVLNGLFVWFDTRIAEPTITHTQLDID